MTEQNPATGEPYGGRDEKETVGPPVTAGRDHENASRAATDGTMAADAPSTMEPGEGVDRRLDGPSPADATEGDQPGGSVANQAGRDPA
jgi:hypothetical protein